MGNGTKTPPGRMGFGTPPLAESKPFLLSTIFKRFSRHREQWRASPNFMPTIGLAFLIRFNLAQRAKKGIVSVDAVRCRSADGVVSCSPIFMVWLRRPRKSDRRTDPFYEFGSFGL